MGKKQDTPSNMHESLLLLAEMDEQGKSVIHTNCTYGELHGITVQLVSFLATHAEISYNQMLAEMREVELEITKEEK